RIAMSAAIAPSVEAIGATTPTFPTRRPRYTSSRPPAFPTPPITSQTRSVVDTSPGPGPAVRTGSSAISPTIITHARTGPSPIIRVEREEHSVAVAHAKAAPRPPRIASIAAVYTAPPSSAGRRGRGDVPSGRRWGGRTARPTGAGPTPRAG